MIKKYMNLILEADPSEEIVKMYLDDSDMYGLFSKGEIICELLMYRIDEQTYELKNIATIDKYRGKGLAKQLVMYVTKLYKDKCQKIIVGTT